MTRYIYIRFLLRSDDPMELCDSVGVGAPSLSSPSNPLASPVGSLRTLYSGMPIFCRRVEIRIILATISAPEICLTV